jgi:hypothetical protein
MDRTDATVREWNDAKADALQTIEPGDVQHGMPVMVRWEEGFANARLIAAAPDAAVALQWHQMPSTPPVRALPSLWLLRPVQRSHGPLPACGW